MLDKALGKLSVREYAPPFLRLIKVSPKPLYRLAKVTITFWIGNEMKKPAPIDASRYSGLIAAEQTTRLTGGFDF